MVAEIRCSSSQVKGFVKKIPAPAPLPNCLFHNQPEASSSKSDPPPPAQPFEYKFKAPDSYNPNPTNYNLGPSIKPTPKRARLTSARAMKAREESLDYGFESGFGGSMNRVFVPDEDSDQREASDEGKRTGMGGMRAWNGIIDDKIDKARRSGAFDRLKGRGKPYQRNDEDDNPHISREDFLMYVSRIAGRHTEECSRLSRSGIVSSSLKAQHLPGSSSSEISTWRWKLSDQNYVKLGSDAQLECVRSM